MRLILLISFFLIGCGPPQEETSASACTLPTKSLFELYSKEELDKLAQEYMSRNSDEAIAMQKWELSHGESFNVTGLSGGECRAHFVEWLCKRLQKPSTPEDFPKSDW